ncbi:MAG: hypothetical protein KDN05_03275 [Verrucomicrobiae bacterium]|nr:hypothetical protein [Verrucomicrobiae bacterium]MCP5533247.1 hypothetical protein [Akkermansiaceae bacterium]MCP5545442.1 hypothetical protein [Akkermansiaceae bacterium]MCP5548962.1 hypothetical protein [Akkermansiaceae bacterium]
MTWTFDRDCTTGQYVTGDPWVVGPVTIVSITPKPVDGRNGTMINPSTGTTQGFDKDFIKGYNDYVSALNVGQSLPLTVPVNSSVVSSITADAYTQFNTIEMFSVLTVVASQPDAGSFRPPVVGSGSKASLWKESQLDYSKLNSLPKSSIASLPAIGNYETWFSYPWVELNPTWTGRYVHTSYMAPSGYGKDIAHRTGDAALLLNLDFTNTQKRKLLIGLVQAGIDNYGFILGGGTWFNDGGHNVGRLSPVIVAAGVLNDSRLKAVIKGGGLKFQEFQSTFFVSQNDVNFTGRVGTNGQQSYPYTASDIGMPEWGIRHTGAPQYDNNFWSALYRDINGSCHTAPTMTARVMGMRTTIGWEPLFQYAERHLTYEQSASYKGEFNSNPTPAFHKQFYNSFKNASAPDGSGGTEPVVYDFAVDDLIKVTKTTNVRQSGALTATKLGEQPVGAAGVIVDGPVGPDADNITWWKVNFHDGVDGWTGQDNYVLVTPPVRPAIKTVEEKTNN